MATITGPNYSVDSQMNFVIQWFRTWSELQKDDFVEILAEKLAAKSKMNGLVNGMQNLDTGTRRVSLFSCQMKLFKEWWDTWSEADKDNMTSRLKESDSKFWATVQEELNGTRKRLEDDFFLTINSPVIVTNGQTPDIVNHTVENVEIINSNGVHSDDDDIQHEPVGFRDNDNLIQMNGDGDEGREDKNEDMDPENEVQSG